MPDQPSPDAVAGDGAPQAPLLLGTSAPMQQALAVLRRAAAGTATVLLRGETGTGKEVAARTLHAESPRAAGPFVTVDCTALPSNLLESELFGYEKGAFTGAVAQKAGRVERAEGGTLFLDEIGEVPLAMQAKLLRLLQQREFERLGGTRTLSADVRLVAATHRDLEAMIARGEFREDLFYRLNVVPVWLPPLRARREDIEPLARHFCAEVARKNGSPPLELDASALRVLRAERWPGNVRQLQNFIERLVVLATGSVIDAEAVRGALATHTGFKTQSSTLEQVVMKSVPPASGPVSSSSNPLDEQLRSAERKALLRALEKTDGNRAAAARLLGVSRSTFYNKLQEHGIE